jgi:hypothetical protein
MMTTVVRALVTATVLTTAVGSGRASTMIDPVDTEPAATEAPPATDNAFLADDTTTNISDCVSALPRPECGSTERGGWRQGIIFGVVVAGLAAIGARLVIGVKRRDVHRQTASDDT